MGAWFKKLWTDPDYFIATMRGVRIAVSSVLGTLALAVMSGQIDLGKFGYWASPLAFGAALIVHGRSQDVLTQIKAMTPDQKAEVLKHLQGGG